MFVASVCVCVCLCLYVCVCVCVCVLLLIPRSVMLTVAVSIYSFVCLVISRIKDFLAYLVMYCRFRNVRDCVCVCVCVCVCLCVASVCVCV